MRITEEENSRGGKCRSVRGHIVCLWPRVSSHLEACGKKPGGPCVAVFCVIGIGTGGSGGAKTSLIFIHAVQIAVYYITCMLHAHGTCILPYSGKFSLVQIFTEKGPDSSEEIFTVFIFVDAGHSGHTPTS